MSDKEFLNACIEETLRLYPVLPSAGARQTKERGITVAGHYIPPYTTVIAPRYSIGRRGYIQQKIVNYIDELIVYLSGKLLRAGLRFRTGKMDGEA